MDKEYNPAVYTNDGNSENIRAIQPKHSSLRVSEENASAILNDMSFHINDAKIELADKLLPLFLTLNNKLESEGFKRKGMKQQNSVAFINALIEQAHNHLDNNLHNEAVKLYPKICFIYQNLSKETKSKVHSECAALHNRINNLKPIF